jgi:mono/diheme cytochrome c family protein
MKRICLLNATLLSVFTIALWGSAAAAEELDRRQRAVVNSIGRTITQAGKNYFEGKFEASATDIRRALEQVQRAADQGSPELYEAIQVHVDKISRAHALLELEGISLPPFRRPPRPASGDANASEMAPEGISFTAQVAPILANRCGQCHVSGRRGGFSLASYAALMKGPAEGVVVFAGDVAGSRLIETIETGDMPRGGGSVPEDELSVLKEWIEQGAKFDGDDPNQTLRAAATPQPDRSMDTPTPQITRARGDETVSFAAEVAPLLVDHCSGCHIGAMQNRGGLRMDSVAQLMRGGDSGPMITPGRGASSLLIKKLRGTAAEGARMPAGGRPPLSEESIELISTWIDEGATIDAEPSQPIEVISQLAWMATASSEEVSARRAEMADRHFALANSASEPAEYTTDHFRVIGSGSEATLELVGQTAEAHLETAKKIARPGKSASPAEYFRGQATLFVLPRRYDYSEFAKMVEGRSVPSDWSAHWTFDGIDAYIAVVATERESEEQIESRLLAPVVSLAVATRGGDVPRWFAEGMGSAMALRQNATSRSEQEKLRTLAVEAASSVKNAKAFLDHRLTPAQADSFGTALALSMLERNRRRGLEGTIRGLNNGQPFEAAFRSGFGVPPEAYIDQFLQYAR